MKNTYEGTQTNDKGNYELSNIKADSVQLQYSFLGYETKMVTVLFKEPTIEKNIQLAISSKMMEEVQVSAIRAENNTPTTYTNLNKEEINQRINKAKAEMNKKDSFDTILVNDDLNKAKNNLSKIVSDFLINE